MSFEKACQFVSSGKGDFKPSDAQQLEIYGLYKQATAGDNNTPKPGVFKFADCKKHEAWTSRKGMSSEAAKTEYVNVLNKMYPSWESM